MNLLQGNITTLRFVVVCLCATIKGVKLSVVRDGHKIPFVTLSPLKVIPNNLSAVTYSHFVSEAISDLSRAKCVDILDRKPDIVNPISISIQPSGRRD